MCVAIQHYTMRDTLSVDTRSKKVLDSRHLFREHSLCPRCVWRLREHHKSMYTKNTQWLSTMGVQDHHKRGPVRV